MTDRIESYLLKKWITRIVEQIAWLACKNDLGTVYIEDNMWLEYVSELCECGLESVLIVHRHLRKDWLGRIFGMSTLQRTRIDLCAPKIIVRAIPALEEMFRRARAVREESESNAKVANDRILPILLQYKS